MKNVLKILIWSMTICMSLTSCGKEEDEPSYNPPSGSSLTAPTGVSGSVVSNGIRLSWNPVNKAEFYTVSRSSSLNGTTVSLGYIGDTGYIYNTSVIDTKPLDGANYYFIYACNNKKGNSYSVSSASAPIYVYYERNGNNPGGGGNENPGGGGNDNPGGGNTQQKPSAPTGISVSNEGNDYIPDVRVRWNSVSNATKYYIYKSSTASGSYSKIGETSYTQYCDSDAPTNGKTAYYKVKAVNDAGESPFSDYAKYTAKSNDEAFSPAYTYGNCTVSGTTMTLRWNNSTGSGYGKATKVILRVWNPYAEEWQDTEQSATATSASFNFSNKIDNSGYVKAGIVVSNDKGSFTAGAKVYDTKGKKWLN
ncbi:MAG: fibronectin type III domain-containing protein [Muribaculaceae bacterium]|nr:fibronectin type III domain-containing protein [Muribaculaceae bacterium]